MDTREAFIAKLKAQLEAWHTEIEQLEARVNAAQGDKRVALNEQIAMLRQHHNEAQQHLTQVQQSAGETWEGVKQQAEVVWARVAQAFAKARERLDQSKAA